MNIDGKEHFLIEEALSCVRSDAFTELDVLALLMLLRRHASQDSAVREFGDFIAHRERDRGLLQKYVALWQSALLPNRINPIGNIEVPALTSTDLHASFNDVLVQVGLEQIEEELANRITVCIISLLQAVRVKSQMRVAVQGFEVAMSSNYIFLRGHGVVAGGHTFAFPILSAFNRGYERSLSIMSVAAPITCDHIVQAFCSRGKFEIAQTSRITPH
jgi:hypothetical protein